VWQTRPDGLGRHPIIRFGDAYGRGVFQAGDGRDRRAASALAGKRYIAALQPILPWRAEDIEQ
jgi:hypothetical protein